MLKFFTIVPAYEFIAIIWCGFDFYYSSKVNGFSVYVNGLSVYVMCYGYATVLTGCYIYVVGVDSKAGNNCCSFGYCKSKLVGSTLNSSAVHCPACEVVTCGRSCFYCKLVTARNALACQLGVIILQSDICSTVLSRGSYIEPSWVLGCHGNLHSCSIFIQIVKSNATAVLHCVIYLLDVSTSNYALAIACTKPKTKHSAHIHNL